MQVNRESDFKDRTLFYWAKLYSEELKTGDEYGELKQTICINIINFDLFACEDYHSSFKIMESERRELLTDKFAIHFFELKKLSKFKTIIARFDAAAQLNVGQARVRIESRVVQGVEFREFHKPMIIHRR